MSKRSVFVTGGTGYVGRPLIQELLARGHRVCALARPGSETKLPPSCIPAGSQVYCYPAKLAHLPAASPIYFAGLRGIIFGSETVRLEAISEDALKVSGVIWRPGKHEGVGPASIRTIVGKLEISECEPYAA